MRVELLVDRVSFGCARRSITTGAPSKTQLTVVDLRDANSSSFEFAKGEGFSEREALAAEFAERFALDHLSMDDPFWVRLRGAFTDSEIVDLGLCVGMWVSQGRLNQILDVDGGCRVPSPDAPLTGG